MKQIKFPVFKALFFAAALMPLTALAVAPPPIWYLNDEDGKIYDTDATGNELELPVGVAVRGGPGNRILELDNVIIEPHAIHFTSNTTIIISRASKINSNEGIVSINNNNITIQESSQSQGNLDIIAVSGIGITADTLILESGTVSIGGGGSFGVDLVGLTVLSGSLTVDGYERALKNSYTVPIGYKFSTIKYASETTSDGENVVSDTKYFKIQGFDPVPGVIKIFADTPVTDASPSKPELDANAQYEIFGWGYWDVEDAKNIDVNAKFEEGKKYNLWVMLKPKLGFVFSRSIAAYLNNNKEVKIKENFGTVMNLEYEFGVTSEIVITIKGENLTIMDNIIAFKMPNSNCAEGSVAIEVAVSDPNAEITFGGKNAKQRIDYDMPLYRIGDNQEYMTINFDGTPKIYTFIVNKPIGFKEIVEEKWNNVLVVNNNPQKNGGLRFEKFRWIKDGNIIKDYGPWQYYSANANQSGRFEVQLLTEDGMEVRSCPGFVDLEKIDPLPATQKRVLGIDGKTAPQGSEVYNTKGERTTGKTPGVYIIRRVSK